MTLFHRWLLLRQFKMLLLQLLALKTMRLFLLQTRSKKHRKIRKNFLWTCSLSKRRTGNREALKKKTWILQLSMLLRFGKTRIPLLTIKLGRLCLVLCNISTKEMRTLLHSLKLRTQKSESQLNKVFKTDSRSKTKFCSRDFTKLLVTKRTIYL